MTPKCSLRHYKRQFLCFHEQKSSCHCPLLVWQFITPNEHLMTYWFQSKLKGRRHFLDANLKGCGWFVGVMGHVSKWLFLSFLHQWDLGFTCKTDRHWIISAPQIPSCFILVRQPLKLVVRRKIFKRLSSVLLKKNTNVTKRGQYQLLYTYLSITLHGKHFFLSGLLSSELILSDIPN